jgi:uracil-DNA glycosylase
VWSERQVAMLDMMGVRVWQRAAPEVAPVPVLQARQPEPAVHVQFAPNPAPSAVVNASQTASMAVAQMDWPELQAAVQNCRACGLCEGRKNTVFGVGHVQADWMVVGEAPGEQEDRQGEPFVGKSGQLLDNMLSAVGLTRHAGTPQQQVYIANTVKCRPPANRNPDASELAQCAPYLARQIALVQPRVIVAMGRFAVQSLLRTTEPIGRLRGRIHRYEGVPLVVTYHPAYLLRNPEDKARAWSDLCLARDVIETTP